MTATAIAVLGGLGAMLGWGMGDFLAKVAVDSVGELTSLAWGHLAGSAVLGCVCVELAARHYIGSFAVTGWTLPLLAAFGAGQASVYYLLYRAFSRGQVSVLSPTFASFSGLVAAYSILVLGEHASVLEIAALIALFLGIVALSLGPASDPSTRRLWKAPGLALTLAATVAAAAWTLGWNQAVAHRDPFLSAAIMYAFMTVLFVAAALAKGGMSPLRPPMAVAVTGIGIGEAVAYLAITWAYSRSSATSITALLSGAFSLPTIVLARIWLNERLSRPALAGAGATIAALTALAISR